MKWAFVSRHAATAEQAKIAALAGIELVPVGDRDGFAINPSEFESFAGVVAVHAGAALALAGSKTPVGVFENANRAPEGEKPSFTATALHLYRPLSDGGEWQGISHEVVR